ncbi:MAG: long-chain-fatty-acid--CoA ligase [Bdellovibrionales bacterium RIFCSPHIGHO2_01_FULL_40_29]|nr:MAG: long-chain-fatty-acid--CoA ligase [Bdellovibrionales bacterium RIFCSPHIGHO2_01_FULL_40_29]OFZ34191.1 MAG: long-chain-fatty-acid--CoA ligase [Bdellovibrionales bacterium RIFCSPHIGHO2_02_FULL_40_15]
MENIWTKKYPKSVPTSINMNEYKNILEIADEAIRKFRNRPAFSNFGIDMTFHELDILAGHFASYLQNDLGLKKGDRIAIQLPNLLQYPIVLFGAFRAGLIVVNTNPLYTAPEMKYQFNDAGVKAIVILAQFAHLLEKIKSETSIEHVIVTQVGDQLPFVKKHLINFVLKKVKKMVPAYTLKHDTWEEALTKGSQKTYVQPNMTLEDTAFLQYTGGTTGVSKGAILSHRNIIANCQQIRAWMKPKLVEGQEIAITPLPLYHIFSLTVCSLALMTYGTQNVLITNPRDFASFIKDMKKYKFTILTGVNTLFNALANHPKISEVDFSKTKVCVAGAMALQKAVKENWFAKTGTNVIEGYGLTETSPVACCNPIDGTDQVGTIGLPLPDTELKFVDDSGKEVALGEPGEICIRGPQVMKGYHNQPAETSKVLKDGWLFTGDIGVMNEDGFAKIVDRKKDMILVSGFNVYPNEIEDVISRHPKILEVAAIGVSDEHSGEVVKVVIVKKDESLTEKEVIDFARLSLTNYKIPKHVEFRKELPKTNVGKILRRALREAPSVA